MRDNNARAFSSIVVLLSLVILAGAAVAQGGKPFWPTYHFDSARTGQNADWSGTEADNANPASLGLVWVFPRDVLTNIDDNTQIVDPTQDPALVDVWGAWRNGTHNEAYINHYLWAYAISRDSGLKPISVYWHFPPLGTGGGQLPPGSYQIAIWVPPISNDPINQVESNTTQAEYEIWDDTGVTRVRFDQQDGGYWKPLSTRYFSFTGKVTDPAQQYYGVVLTNATYDSQDDIDAAAEAGNPVTVCADAVKFIPSTGQEIYASPTSGEIQWTCPDPAGGSAFWDGLTPFVFVGTVEQPLVASDEPMDTGAVYAINSVTPTRTPLSELVGTPGYGRYKTLSDYLGTALWRYPNPDPSPDQRAEIEGPIEGGIYSTPTLAYVDGVLTCFVAAMDRQVYAIEAETGKLLWKGPGVTLGETNAQHQGTWNIMPDRPDAFGGKFEWAKCVDSTADPTPAPSSMTWQFTDALRGAAGETVGGTSGWSYAVYAWMPVRAGSDPPRISDATYTITYREYQATGPANVSVDVTIDQSSIENQGKWVKLGTSYFSVSSVKLSNATRAHLTSAAQAAGRTAGDFSVVADAVMIVPETMGPFSYSSVVTDAASRGADAGVVYAANSQGRLLAFDAATGKVRWIYPAVRDNLVVSAGSPGDQDPLGEIGASPAYFDDGGRRLCVATYGANEGKVYCLDVNADLNKTTADPPTELWVFPNAKDEEDRIFPAGFTSSPAVDAANGRIYIGSTNGIFYCLKTGAGAPDKQRIWTYPVDSADPAEPGIPTPIGLGGFRYSTAAVATDRRNTRRVWVGSSDGHIYSFLALAATAERLGVDSEGNQLNSNWYADPSVLSPVQASVAVDASQYPVMYVGDMRGTLSWFNATTGASEWYDNNKYYKGWLTEGELFSSPNITAYDIPGAGPVCWIYNGCSDGRVYAFSHSTGAWGGEWSGGKWPFEGDPRGDSQKLETLAPDTEIQFDIFPGDFYENSLRNNPEPSSDGNFPAWPDDWIVSENMKLVAGDSITDENANDTKDDEIDEELRKLALLQRKDHVFAQGVRTTATAEGVYFEWGEKINLILWNLPGSEYLYGTDTTAKRNNIRFLFTNASPGANAGSQLTIAGGRKVLKEYTVLNNKEQTKQGDDGQTITYYEPVKYDTGKEVKRCYMLAQIDIGGSRPPTPGPGWVLSVELKRKEDSGKDAPIIPEVIPLARLEMDQVDTLTANKQSQVPVPRLRPLKEGADSENKVPGEWDYTQQPLGINNPLAINIGGLQQAQIAWGNLDRYDPAAHMNGNPPTIMGRHAPLLYLGGVAHGTASSEYVFGVADRSATGCNVTRPGNPPDTKHLGDFRVSAEDLRWRGGEDAIRARANAGSLMAYGIRLPWEQGPGSADYPNILRTRQSYRKVYDDADPSRKATELPPVRLQYDTVTGNWDTNYPPDRNPAPTSPQLRPDTVYVSVDVPRFQPANTYGLINTGDAGYLSIMQAFIDSYQNGRWDSGTTILGRPSTYQEAYREFRLGLDVPPDPRIEVEEDTVDIGRAPHGLGDELPYAFNPFNPHPLVQQWFKKLTIKNAGNVNLYNLGIGRHAANGWHLGLFSDQANPLAPLPGYYIVSSLDKTDNMRPFTEEPFTTGDIGYTLSKPRVGDPDPTVMTIPDQRKWDLDYNYTREYAAKAMSNPATLWPTDRPLPILVSAAVPLSQPQGTYGSWDPATKMPAPVPIFSDLNGDRQVESGEPVADPSFQLKLTVKETQLTGGVTPTSLPQIDVPPVGGMLPRVGDATPAAFRDPYTGNVHVFWSSNRMFDPDLYPNFTDPNDTRQADFANAPWFIDYATLVWGENGWEPVKDSGGHAPMQWWVTPAPGTSDPWLPEFQWPAPLLGGGGVIPWEFGGSPTNLKSVRHYSPVIAQNEEALADDPSADKGLTWLAWAGTADVMSDPSNTVEKVEQEHRIFYTDATHGRVTDDSGGGVMVHSIEHDPAMVKRYPSMSIFRYNDADGNIHEPMWMFWQGGESGKWGIYYSINSSAPDHPSAAWSNDLQLRTPDCLASVGSPNAVRRTLWDTHDNFFDMVYAGVSKLTQNSDILLGRYAAETDPRGVFSPGRGAVPMPRVFAEKLQRDQKFGFFTSRHLAWIRLTRGEEPVTDNWGGYDPAAPNPDLPYVHVVLPEGYEVTADGKATPLPAGTVVSGTDGSIRVPDSEDPNTLVELVPPAAIKPEIDAATGVYTYKYPNPATTEILGEMLVDFSAGIVRFTKPLKEIRSEDDKAVSVSNVYADYTPQTWRITTDLAGDSSPRAFIERTPMTRENNPGLGDPQKSGPVDRLWVFWRKAGTSIESSTIYYSTYRVGIDLTKTKLYDNSGNPIHLPPIPINSDGSPGGGLTVSGNFSGTWDVDGTGTRIYFTQADERCRSLERALGGGPGRITINYKVGAAEYEAFAPDVCWLEELPEQALLGYSAEGGVNEGSIYAFADPDPEARALNGTFGKVGSSKIWIFWTSTRAGTSDLFWETLSPDFAVRSDNISRP